MKMAVFQWFRCFVGSPPIWGLFLASWPLAGLLLASGFLLASGLLLASCWLLAGYRLPHEDSSRKSVFHKARKINEFSS